MKKSALDRKNVLTMQRDFLYLSCVEEAWRFVELDFG